MNKDQLSYNEPDGSPLNDQSELKKTVLSGFAWTTVAVTTVRVLAFVLQLILAKLLAPSIFGIIALANVVIGALELFSNFGFGRALIQYKGDIKAAANVALTLRAVQGAIFLIIAIVFAGRYAVYFDSPVLKYIIPVLGANFLISALWSIPMSLLERELQFRKQVIPQTLPAVLQFTTAVTMAVLGFGVWSIVCGVVVLNISQTILFLRISPYRLKFAFDYVIFKKLMAFGLPLFASSLVWYLVTYTPTAIIGKLYNNEALGFYSFAFTFISLPITELIYNILNKVLYPTYSKLSHDREQLRNGYLKSFRYLTMMTIPLSIGIPLFGGDFFQALYGDKWVPAIAPLQAFGVYAFMRSIAASAGSVFLALGKTKYLLGNALVCLAIIGIFIYPVTVKYGITGVAGLLSIAWTITLLVLLIWMRRIAGIKLYSMAKLLVVPVTGSLLAMIPMKYMLGAFFPLEKIYIFIPVIAVTVSLYVLLITLLDKTAGQSIRQSVEQRKLVLI